MISHKHSKPLTSRFTKPNKQIGWLVGWLVGIHFALTQYVMSCHVIIPYEAYGNTLISCISHLK